MPANALHPAKALLAPLTILTKKIAAGFHRFWRHRTMGHWDPDVIPLTQRRRCITTTSSVKPCWPKARHEPYFESRGGHMKRHQTKWGLIVSTSAFALMLLAAPMVAHPTAALAASASGHSDSHSTSGGGATSSTSHSDATADGAGA